MRIAPAGIATGMQAYDQQDEQAYYDRAAWGVLHDYQREVLTDLCAVLPDDARTVLDVGCGDGAITDRLPADRFVVGVDLSSVALAGLKRPGVVGSALSLPMRDRAFDLVMANDVVEHFSPEHRAGVLSEIERVADRYVVVTVPFTERLANGMRYGPGGPVHRNRHRDAFDVATARSFFRDLELKACLFSGVTWEDESAPVERLKVLRATLSDGEEGEPVSADLRARLDREIARLRRSQAADLSRHPERIDLLQRRTELIAVFARPGRDLALRRRLDALGAVDLATAIASARSHDVLRLDAARFENFRVGQLPIASLWPYAVFSGETREAALGVDLTCETSPASLKVGFFAALDEGARFEASLELGEPAAIQINLHEGDGCYRILTATTLPSGISTVRTGPLSLAASEFGHLFDVVVAAPRFTFLGCRIDQPRRVERLAVAPGPRYLSRKADGLTLLTSLACLPHRALPSWFKSAETLSAPPTDPYFGSLAEVDFALDELRLRPEEAKPVAEEAARHEESRRWLGDRALRRIAEIVPKGIKRLGRGAMRVARARGRVALGPAPRPPATSARPSGDGLPSTVTMLVPDDRIDRRVLLQGRSLARRGVKVTVVAAPYPDATDGDAAQFPELTIVRIDTSRTVPRPVDASRTSLSRHAFAWREVYFYHEHFLRAALEHPAEIVVAHDLPVLPAAIAAAELGGTRTFYDAHELYPEQDHFGPCRRELLRDVEAALIGSAAAVTTVNRSIADEMARRYGIAPPGVILNAPDADEPVPLPRTHLLREALNLGDDRTIVLFQGSLSINRNLEPLVEAMAFMKDPSAVLVVMGPGAGKRRELEAMARARGLLGTRVLFHDAVPQSELLRFTASADIGVIPYPGIDLNTTFCTPNKLFEFMAAGLPILANDLPELRRFVADGGVGLVHAMTDAASIAAGIDRMLAADRSGFRDALRTVAPGMTWQAQEPALLDIYRDFMKGIGRTAA